MNSPKMNSRILVATQNYLDNLSIKLNWSESKIIDCLDSLNDKFIYWNRTQKKISLILNQEKNINSMNQEQQILYLALRTFIPHE